MIDAELRRVLLVGSHPMWLDLAILLPALFPGTECRTLDEWLDHLRVGATDRHSALGDALATAQLMQVLLAAARKVGMGRGQDLIKLQQAQQWLGKR
jgi:DNA polymerase-3 subunit epsilon